MTRISVSQLDEWDSVEDHDARDWEVPEVDVLQRADEQLPKLMAIVDGESSARLMRWLERDRGMVPTAADPHPVPVEGSRDPSDGA